MIIVKVNVENAVLQLSYTHIVAPVDGHADRDFRRRDHR